MNAQTPPKVLHEEKIKAEIFEIYEALLVEGLGYSKTLIPKI
jgi:hypothetical protein